MYVLLNTISVYIRTRKGIYYEICVCMDIYVIYYIHNEFIYKIHIAYNTLYIRI